MTWFKVDDAFWGHPKVLAAPPRAIALWVLAGSWAAQQLTDGHVPRSALKALRAQPAAARELVNAGLWEVVDEASGGGWRFHDWADFQPTREQISAERRAAADRMRRIRKGKSSSPKEGKEPRSEQESPGDVRANIERTNSERSPEVRQPRPDPTRTTFGSSTAEVRSQRASGGGEAPPRGGRRKATAAPPEPTVTAELVPLTDVPGHDVAVRALPTPQHLVSAWIDGWRATHDGADPTPAMIKRVSGKATELSRGLDIEGMRAAWRTCQALGAEGTWDVVGQQPRAQRAPDPTRRSNGYAALAQELREAGL